MWVKSVRRLKHSLDCLLRAIEGVLPTLGISMAWPSWNFRVDALFHASPILPLP